MLRHNGAMIGNSVEMLVLSLSSKPLRPPVAEDTTLACEPDETTTGFD